MTIRVYTVNRHGTVIRERGTVNVLPSSEPPPFSSDFPPCNCRGCRKTRAVGADPLGATAGSAPCPPDLAAMRGIAALLLGPDDGPEALPPVPENLDVVTAALREHLELLIPEVEMKAGRLPDDSIPRHCALACVGEARRRLTAGPSPRFGGDAGHARRLARVLRALCRHYENGSRQAP